MTVYRTTVILFLKYVCFGMGGCWKGVGRALGGCWEGVGRALASGEGWARQRNFLLTFSEST